MQGFRLGFLKLTMIRGGRKLCKRRLKKRKLCKRRLKKQWKILSRSLSSNVTSLMLALTWPYGFLVSKTFSGKIPCKFILHGLLVECKEGTLKYNWDGLLEEIKKEIPPKDPSPDSNENAKDVDKFLREIPSKLQSRLERNWPSFEQGEYANMIYWMGRWDKHGSKIGLKLTEYLNLSLYLRRLFTAGLNLKINMPMKAEDLIQRIKCHLLEKLNLDVTPRIKCRFDPELLIPRPTRKIQRKIFRRRLYVLEEIKIGVDPKNLKFVNTGMDSYQGCRAKSLIIIPYLEYLPDKVKLSGAPAE